MGSQFTATPVLPGYPGSGEKVLRWIDAHKDDMVKFCMDYVKYPSLFNEELEVQRDFINPYFNEQMSFDEVEYLSTAKDPERPNVSGLLKGTGGGKCLPFQGHSDVVPVSEGKLTRWTKDPWKAVIEDGNIYGRGATDMKGGNSALVFAVKAPMECDVKLKGDLILSLVVGEENNTQADGVIPATRSFQEKGYDISFCVNAEPTNCEIHTISSGLFDFIVEIEGKETHN